MNDLNTNQETTAGLTANLDMPALAELQDLLEEDFVGLLEEFIDSSEQGGAELVEHIQQLNFDEVRRGAHSLKGSALNIGAPDLGALWSALEEAAVQQVPMDTLVALLRPARLELEQTTETLRKQFFKPQN